MHVLTYLFPPTHIEMRDWIGMMALAAIVGLLYHRAGKLMLLNFYHFKGWDWNDGKIETVEHRRHLLKARFSILHPGNWGDLIPHVSAFLRGLTYLLWIFSVIYLAIVFSLAVKEADPYSFFILNSLSLFFSSIFLTNVIVYASQISQRKQLVKL